MSEESDSVDKLSEVLAEFSKHTAEELEQISEEFQIGSPLKGGYSSSEYEGIYCMVCHETFVADEPWEDDLQMFKDHRDADGRCPEE